MSGAPPKPPLLPKPQPPEGFWALPGGRGGFSGTIAGVSTALDSLPEVPAHAKAALKSFISAQVAGTDANYVTVHAHAQRRADGTTSNAVITIQIETSKRNL